MPSNVTFFLDFGCLTNILHVKNVSQLKKIVFLQKSAESATLSRVNVSSNLY